MADKSALYSQAVWQITKTLQEVKTLREGLTAALRISGRAMGVEEGSFWYHNRSDNRIYPIATLGDATALAGMSLQYGEGIAGDVVKTGIYAFVPDCEKDPRFANRFDKESGFTTKSMICMPLKSGERVIGCMQLINKLDGSLFDDADLKLCQDLATLAGIAMEGASLSINVRPRTESILSLRSVIKDYGFGEDRVRALRGVTLDAYEGEIMAVVGARGAGLRALRDVMGGLSPLTSGSMTAEGLDLTRADDKTLEKYRRERVGFVFEESGYLENLTCEENIELIARLSKKPMKTGEALHMAGLAAYAARTPAFLPPAQKRLLSFACALAKRPRFLLSTEPTGDLPSDEARPVLHLIEKLPSLGQTVVLITQNQELARMAGRVLKLQSGVIADVTANGSPLPAEEVEW